jgi:hypothetical protein
MNYENADEQAVDCGFSCDLVYCLPRPMARLGDVWPRFPFVDDGDLCWSHRCRRFPLLQNLPFNAK